MTLQRLLNYLRKQGFTEIEEYYDEEEKADNLIDFRAVKKLKDRDYILLLRIELSCNDIQILYVGIFPDEEYNFEAIRESNEIKNIVITMENQIKKDLGEERGTGGFGSTGK